MENRVKELRLARGLTQQKLAELVETSQQQIQRIESGRVAARLELGAKISTALGVSLDEVFPGALRLLVETSSEQGLRRYLRGGALDELRKRGVEADPRTWFFRALLRGHDEAKLFCISAEEHERLFEQVQDERLNACGMSFVLFDSQNERIALNLSELVYCHFLFEASLSEPDVPRPNDEQVALYFKNRSAPVTFSVGIDEGHPDDEAGDGDQGQFRHILFMLENHVSEGGRLGFVDVDGEHAFIRAGDIAMLQVPLHVIDPSDDEGDLLLVGNGQI